MVIKSGYAGVCKRCGGPIAKGEDVNWERGAGAWHLECPEGAEPSKPREVQVTEIGVYERPDGEIFVVKPNREKTRLYAKRLVEQGGKRETIADVEVQKIAFEYDQGAIFTLTPEMKMPFERAKELVLRYRRCIVCGAHLKDAKSVERGIGPVCIKSFRQNALPTPGKAYTEMGDEATVKAQLALDENESWIALKNEAADREAKQERAAYEAKLARDEALEVNTPEMLARADQAARLPTAAEVKQAFTTLEQAGAHIEVKMDTQGKIAFVITLREAQAEAVLYTDPS